LVVLLIACGGGSDTGASPTQTPQPPASPPGSIAHCLSDDGRSLELELEARNHFRTLLAEGARYPSSWQVGIVQVRVAPDGSQRLMMEYGPDGTLWLWTGSVDPETCAATLETTEGRPIPNEQ
jgi:hypothetical protein